jgi:thiazole/oxazole-forming peptide maturase SagC family component
MPDNNIEKEQFVLNPYLKVVLCSEDEILVKHGVRSNFSTIIEDKDRKRLIGKIVNNSRSPTSLDELLAKGMIKESDYQDAESLIDYLRQEHVLVNPSQNLVNVYLKGILQGESQLSQFAVGVIGAGYLGSRIIHQLLRLGVKEVIILDSRKVEDTRVEECYFDILPELIIENQSYTEIVQSHLSSHGFGNTTGVEGSFEDEEAVSRAFKDSDFIVAALEFFSPVTLHTINKIALSFGKPWISVYIDGSEAIIGPTYVPGETCCYNEFEIQSEASLRFRDEYLLYKEYMEEEGVSLLNLIIPPYLDIASGYTTTSVIHFLIRGYSFTIGRAIFIDFERLSIDFQEILKLPRCPACAGIKPAYKNLFI